MAVEEPRKRGPRIRKTAPTVRERVEAAQAEAENPKTSRLKASTNRVKKPFSRIKLPENTATKGLKKSGRGIRRALSWLVPRYFVNSWREVKQVTWPSRRETWRLTLAVFVFAVIFGAMVSGVDKGLDILFKKVILK